MRLTALGVAPLAVIGSVSLGLGVAWGAGSRTDTGAAPRAPAQSFYFDPVAQVPGSALDVALDGDRAFVANGLGMVMYDVSDPSSPSELDSVSVQAPVQQVAADADRVLISHESTVWLLAVDGNRLESAARFILDERVNDLDVQHDEAWVTTDEYVMRVDISKPDEPQELDRVPLGGAELWVRDQTAALVDWSQPVLRLLVSRQSGFWELLGEWRYERQDSATSLVWDGDVIYIGAILHGEFLVTPLATVTPGGTPETPVPFDSSDAVQQPMTTPPPDEGRIYAIDVSDLRNPRTLWVQRVEAPVRSMALDRDRSRLFTTGGDQPGWGAAVQAFDVSNPGGPSSLGLTVRGKPFGGLKARALAFGGDHLYAAAWDDGLWIMRGVGPGDPTPTPTGSPTSTVSATPSVATATRTPTLEGPASGRVAYLPNIVVGESE